MTSLGDLLHESGPLRVIVEVKARAVEDAHRRRLEEVGLVVERVVGNKLIGVVPAEKLAALESDAVVAAVERSVKLKPHS